MTVRDRTLEIVAIAQKSLKSGDRTQFDALTLQELRDAHEELGQRDFNNDFRIRMTNRIADLEKEQERRAETRWRFWDHAITFVAGVVTALIVAGLLGWLGWGK